MKNFKIKFGLFSLLAVLTVSVFLTSCEQEAIPTPELPEMVHQQMEVLSSEVLQESDVRVAELKTIVENEVVEMATPHFDMVSYIEYSDPGVTALILPCITEGKAKVSWLINYFTDGQYKNSVFIEFTPTEEYARKVVNDNTVEYSGEFALYTKSAEVISKSVFQKGAVVETFENTELRGCISDCFGWYLDQLPWYSRWGCKASLAPCVGGLIATGLVVAGVVTAPAATITGSIAAVGCGVLAACIGSAFGSCTSWC